MVHVWTDRHTPAQSVGRIREGGEGGGKGWEGKGEGEEGGRRREGGGRRRGVEVDGVETCGEKEGKEFGGETQ